MPAKDNAGDRRVGTYSCQECGLRVRLSVMFHIGSMGHDCQRCGEETRHGLVGELVPESEAVSYV